MSTIKIKGSPYVESFICKVIHRDTLNCQYHPSVSKLAHSMSSSSGAQMVENAKWLSKNGKFLDCIFSPLLIGLNNRSIWSHVNKFSDVTQCAGDGK